MKTGSRRVFSQANTTESAAGSSPLANLLPAELSAKILGQLSPSDWDRARQVNRAWRRSAEHPLVADAVARRTGLLPSRPALFSSPPVSGGLGAVREELRLINRLRDGSLPVDAPQRSTGFREFHYLFATEGVARPLLFFGRDLPFLPFADERHVLITPPSGGVASGYLALGGAAAERLQVVDLGTPSTLTLTAPLGFTGAWKDFGFLGDGLRLFANGLSVAHVSSASGDFAEPWIRLTAPGTGPDAPRMTNSTDGRWTAVWTLDSDASHFNLYDHSQTPPTLREVSKRGSDIQSVDFTPDSQYAVAVSRHRITRRYGLFTVRVNDFHVGRTITFGQARRAPRVFLRRFTADGASMELYGTEQVAQRNDNNFRVTLHRSVPAQPLLSNTIPGDENSLPWHLGSRRIFYVARTGELKAVGQTSEGDELGGGHLGLAPG